jgi:MFS family permease
MHRWFSERQLVLSGLGAATIVITCAYLSQVAFYAYPLAGLMLGSVFPMGLAWFAGLSAEDGNGVSWLVLGAQVGGVLGPAIEILVVSIFGLRFVPLVAAALSAADLAVFAITLRLTAKLRPSPGS